MWIIKNIQNFFSEWFNILTLPAIYKESIRKNWWHILSFVLGAIFCLSVIRLPQWYLRTFPTWRTQIDTSLSEAKQNYPQDLRVTWRGSELSIQPTTPLSISFPSWWYELQEIQNTKASTQLKPPSHLAYILPTATGSAQLTQELENQSHLQNLSINPWFVLTNQTLSVNNWLGNWATTSWSDVLKDTSHFEVTADTFPSQSGKLLSFFDFLVSVSWPFLLSVEVLLSLLAILWSILWEGLFLYFFIRLSGMRMTLPSVLKLSAYLNVAAATIFTIASWMYPNLLPYWQTFSLWIYFFVVFSTQFASSKET